MDRSQVEAKPSADTERDQAEVPLPWLSQYLGTRTFQDNKEGESHRRDNQMVKGTRRRAGAHLSCL
jgi:hypothetical protein